MELRKRLSLRKDNRGATLIIVLVAMAFITVLGATLLFTAYTGYQMKIVERQGKATFYDAESAMDEIRAGLQVAHSNAIVEAYTKVLGEYSTITEESAEAKFRTYFVQALNNWEKSDMPLFSTDGKVYYVGVLRSFLTPGVLQGDVTVSGGTGLDGDTAGTAIVRPEGITLKDITVEYRRGGYYSKVTTDIYMNTPRFIYTMSDLIMTAVPDYAMIARTELTGFGQATLDIDNGNAYAGAIKINLAGNQLTVKNGTVICKGNLDLLDGGSFVLDNRSILWANEIQLGNSSVLNLEGDSYVADDLNLEGDGARAILQGRYFGFGNGLIAGGGDETSIAETNSAILINGKYAQLDISRLQNLMLAGTGFIGTSEPLGQSNSDVATGESILPKGIQTAYLIPTPCLSDVATNPMIYRTGQVPDAEDLKSLVVDGILWGNKRMSDYGAQVQLVYYPITQSQTLVYFYMQFSGPDDAGAYFKDYFTHNKESIEKYLGAYSTGIVAATSAVKNTAGNLLYSSLSSGSGRATATLVSETGAVSAATSAQLGSMYANLCQTLSSNLPGNPNEDVYDYIVNEPAINSALDYGDLLAFREGSQVMGLIKRGDYIMASTDFGVTGTYKDVKIIIATGDVTVNTDYQGLIISGGTVTITGNRMIKASRDGVNAAFRSTATVGGETKELQTFMTIGGETSNIDTSSDQTSWDLEDLVVYQNWSKN